MIAQELGGLTDSVTEGPLQFRPCARCSIFSFHSSSQISIARPTGRKFSQPQQTLLGGLQTPIAHQQMQLSQNMEGVPLSIPFPKSSILQAVPLIHNAELISNFFSLLSEQQQQQQTSFSQGMLLPHHAIPVIDVQVQLQIEQLQQQMAITQQQLNNTSAALAVTQLEMGCTATPIQDCLQLATTSINPHQHTDHASRATFSSGTAATLADAPPLTQTHPVPADPLGQLPCAAFEKECTGCHVTKPLSEFCRNPTSPDGLRSKCRGCVRILRTKVAVTVPASQKKRCQVGFM